MWEVKGRVLPSWVKYLRHYTNFKGLDGILKDGALMPSMAEDGGVPLDMGDGVYFTDLFTTDPNAGIGRLGEPTEDARKAIAERVNKQLGNPDVFSSFVDADPKYLPHLWEWRKTEFPHQYCLQVQSPLLLASFPSLTGVFK